MQGKHTTSINENLASARMETFNNLSLIPVNADNFFPIGSKSQLQIGTELAKRPFILDHFNSMNLYSYEHV